MKAGLGLLLMSGLAVAAPRPITIKVHNTPLFDVARKLGEQTGCRIMGFSAQNVDLDVTNATLWDVLARLEIDQGIQTQFRGGQIVLDRTPSTMTYGLDPIPTWTKHWRGGAGGWATALFGDRLDTRLRLAVLGLETGTIEKVVIAKATSNGKAIKVTPGGPVAINACAPAVLALDADVAMKKVTLRGHLVVKIPKLIERRIAVPLDASVVDVAEGRLRVHVASRLANGARVVHVGWDTMGDQAKVGVQLVDDQDQPISTTGRGSSSAGTMGSEDFNVATSVTKLYVILKLPGTATLDEKVAFRFDNEPLDKPRP